MLPKWHILLGAIFSVLVYFIFHITILEAFLILFASIIIDFDHYLLYGFIKKDWKLKNAITWFKEKKKIYLSLPEEKRQEFKKPIFILHGIEFLLIIFVVSLFFPLFFWIFIGLLFHMLFDFLELIYIKEPLYSKLSVLVVYFKNKNKKEIDF